MGIRNKKTVPWNIPIDKNKNFPSPLKSSIPGDEWEVLSRERALPAYKLIQRLVKDESKAIKLIRENLNRIQTSNEEKEKILKSLVGLNSLDPEKRKASEHYLFKNNYKAGPFLKAEVNQENSLEKKFAIRRLISRNKFHPIVEGDYLAIYRSIYILRMLGTKNAKGTLESIKIKFPLTFLYEDANISLKTFFP